MHIVRVQRITFFASADFQILHNGVLSTVAVTTCMPVA